MSETILNSNVEEYNPSSAVIKVEDNSFSQNVDRSSQFTDNSVSPNDYKALKCEIRVLRAELFKSEDSYNDLLAKYKDLRYSEAQKIKLMTASTETEVTNDYTKLKLEPKNKDAAISALTVMNKELEHKIKILKQELNELKSSRILDRQIFLHRVEKLLEYNGVLVSKLQNLIFLNEKPTGSAPITGATHALMLLAYVIWKSVKYNKTSRFQFVTFCTNTEDNDMPFIPPEMEEPGPPRPPFPLRRGSDYPFPPLPPMKPRKYDDNEPNEDNSESSNSFENLFKVKEVESIILNRKRLAKQSSNPDRRTNRWPKNHNKRLQKAYKGAKKGKRKDH